MQELSSPCALCAQGWTMLGAAPGDMKPQRSSRKKKAEEETKGGFDVSPFALGSAGCSPECV